MNSNNRQQPIEIKNLTFYTPISIDAQADLSGARLWGTLVKNKDQLKKAAEYLNLNLLWQNKEKIVKAPINALKNGVKSIKHISHRPPI